ncbi:hypothetical protein FS837_012769 [Tulasnella sp. UAMH 9824]|nr:hypothetical protein FS837_012769 [Tulasnella sp. UAMH 9824]
MNVSNRIGGPRRHVPRPLNYIQDLSARAGSLAILVGSNLQGAGHPRSDPQQDRQSSPGLTVLLVELDDLLAPGFLNQFGMHRHSVSGQHDEDKPTPATTLATHASVQNFRNPLHQRLSSHQRCQKGIHHARDQYYPLHWLRRCFELLGRRSLLHLPRFNITRKHRTEFIDASARTNIWGRVMARNGTSLNPSFLNYIQGPERTGRVAIRAGSNWQEQATFAPAPAPPLKPSRAAGKEFIMLETNTTSCAGFAGASESYSAGRLYLIDLALQGASIGMRQILLHNGGVGQTYNLFTPSPRTTRRHSVNGQPHPRTTPR